MLGIPEVVGKKAVDEAVISGPKLWRKWRRTDVAEALTKQVEVLKKENESLREQLNPKRQFEQQKTGMERRLEDGSMYRDADGRHFCGLCADVEMLWVALEPQEEGSYYCAIHKHTFETLERKVRRKENSRPLPIKQFHGPQSWMR